ncbi:Zinc finger domain containing protein [Aphelenchoides fujianensis]|nr:Zinc finger domain containing protein [Aphelenchoides fujianensis]KAI6233200.1 Zinc finger domain containing protein [Aphelenchoides fujianensis]
MRDVQEVLAEEAAEEEKWRREHEEMHEKHRGHDVMHAEMFLIFIVALVVAQIVLVTWKRKHFKSYQLATLVGMWAIPFVISIQKGFWRFLLTWITFTAISVYIWNLSSRQHISGKAPRFVYTWFILLHKLSYVLGVAGYFGMMGAMLGVNFIFGMKTTTFMDAGILLMFYGLYYGVLGRDFAHICTDRMACKIGYFTHEGLPKKVLESNVCGVCGDRLQRPFKEHDEDAADETESYEEKSYTLSCQHVFHESCIRGWVVVGKQQTCPYCKEKVDLKRMFKNPWEKPHLFYGRLLDWIRYLVAWQPVIIFLVQGVNKILGLE